LRDEFGGEVTRPDLRFAVNGLGVSVHEKEAFAIEALREEFGIPCTRNVVFRLVDLSRDDLEMHILDMVNFLLHRESGDAVLENGVAYLRRVGGEIVLYHPDGEQGLMNSEGQGRITLPFRVEKQFTRPPRTR
jgi:hypothetical protein